jgi:thiol-disulfide isomerase/thioredoxin
MTKKISTLSFIILIFLLASCGSSNQTDRTNRATDRSQTKQIKPAPEPLPHVKPRQTAGRQTPTAAASATEPKPNLIQFAAYDIKGNLHNSDEWIGKQPTVVNVWGTWCPPCRREIPDLVRLNQEYREKGVALLGLAVRDTPQKVERYAAANKMTWVMMMGERAHLYTLGVTTGVPTTIFFNRDGKEVQRFVGPRGYDVFKQAFEAIL